MVIWYWLVIAFCAGVVFATFINEWFDWDNTLTDILADITLVITFVPLWIYNAFFKLTVAHPVTKEQFEKVKNEYIPDEKVKYLFGNLYSWYAPKANSIMHRWFLVRIKEE